MAWNSLLLVMQLCKIQDRFVCLKAQGCLLIYWTPNRTFVLLLVQSYINHHIEMFLKRKEVKMCPCQWYVLVPWKHSKKRTVVSCNTNLSSVAWYETNSFCMCFFAAGPRFMNSDCVRVATSCDIQVIRSEWFACKANKSMPTVVILAWTC